MIKVHAFISGRVQGVGFRFFTKQKARSLKLSGWVRNRLDGRVELEVIGKPEAIDKLISWLYQGSPLSWVDNIEIVERVAVSQYFPGLFKVKPTS
jgi:acylphosphatase